MDFSFEFSIIFQLKFFTQYIIIRFMIETFIWQGGVSELKLAKGRPI